ncbi:MAG TPA: hypothetical protein VJB92_00650 [Candidatus Paceibacterota bacterium]
MKIKPFAKKLLKKLNPSPPVGGLAVSSNALRFVSLREGEKPIAVSLRLPPGILENGRVKDLQNFKMALKNLHLQIASLKKPLNVVLNLPAGLVYTQSFAIPLIAEERLEETAKLNLEMISPIDFKSAYSGWQKIGESFAEGGQLELLGSFVEAAAVDAFFGALREANFQVVAVEFPALALARVASQDQSFKDSKARLLIDATDEGAHIMVLKNGNPHFSRFQTWAAVYEELGVKKIGKEDFQNFLVQDIQKVINFYSGKQGGSITEAVMTSGQITPEISKTLEINFGLKIRPLDIGTFSGFASLWFPALGSALRGGLERSKDNFISLTNAPVQIQYWRGRILEFISLWRKILLTFAAFIFVMLFSLNMFLSREAGKVRERLASSAGEKELSELVELEKKAKEFNQLVAFSSKAKEDSHAWSEFFLEMQNIAGSGVAIKRLSVNQIDVLVIASTANENEALRFKGKLEQEPDFEGVNLPLANIKTNADGSVDFSLSFKLKVLRF